MLGRFAKKQTWKGEKKSWGMSLTHGRHYGSPKITSRQPRSFLVIKKSSLKNTWSQDDHLIFYFISLILLYRSNKFTTEAGSFFHVIIQFLAHQDSMTENGWPNGIQSFQTHLAVWSKLVVFFGWKQMPFPLFKVVIELVG